MVRVVAVVVVASQLDYYVRQFQASGMDGPLNWYRTPDLNWELTPHLSGLKVCVPVLRHVGKTLPAGSQK